MKQAQADYRSQNIGRRIEFSAPGAVISLVNDLECNGFAVATMEDFADGPEICLKRLSSSLGLGDPVVPALYRRENAEQYANLYHEVQRNPADQHPGFSTTDGQALHADGLADEIGKLKTSILYCVRAAHAGGETVIFNAVAAFDTLRESDAEAASALLDPCALERRATIPGVEASAIGPVFAIEPDGTVITRFTDNDTCAWNHSVGPAGSLGRGLEFLREAAQDPRYRTAVRLARGEALIFRNDRVSHGRTSYQDSPRHRRLLVRAVYGRPPRPES
ncbi:TauD/TfdA family dioxygenase [Streptomyces sp. NBC_00654]|uniref:TauD/TfdA family dioxygenase n=1 Tax=Streptomyces sp. NBC_00654 TaxID=2975799 RepID=UPI00225349FC|nr:TauD/TfdA family dioxygenase [Streptomyces sp. NBC_00654]MCX4966418.1 TauD/TfdA family dioxygenase [Streptomyces sp. NBC_00654]